MLILSIESSCDETAAAVVEDGRNVLSSVVASQIETHQRYGGVVPEIASRMHAEAIVPVTNQALIESGVSLKDIDAIAVTYGPGLIGSLLVGVNFAKGVSLSQGIPLIPVHHLRSHIAANYITHKNLKPPFLCLVVSGGHSHIVEVKSYNEFKIVGRTRDDAAGETFDKAARALGLPYPGGVHLDKVAEAGDEKAFSFPRPKISDSKYDYSFSGLKTSIINMLHNAKQKGIDLKVEDVAASFRKAVVDYLVDNFMKAAKDLGYSKLAISGGVSANSLLRRNLSFECKKRNWEFFMPELSLCGDNAAMVGAQGYYEFIQGNTAKIDLNAYANVPIEYGL